MNQDVQVKWTGALRSGEFEQGRLRLRTGDTYCCLGVLCELYRRETGKGQWLQVVNGGTYYFEAAPDVTSMMYLPGPVRRWAGLDTVPAASDLESDMTALNDDGRSFKSIARAIEARS